MPAPGPDPVNCTGLKPTGSSPTQGLQEAIDGAQSGDTLRLCAGTWNLTSTVVIGKNLTLIGAGAGQTVLDGGNAVRVLQIAAGAEATLQNLTITKGQASDAGGILNQGILTLGGVHVTGNTATARVGVGGGIANDIGGMVTLENGSRVSGNTAVLGGGIFNYRGTTTLEAGSSVSGNTVSTPPPLSPYGGGIRIYQGTVTVASEQIVINNCPDNCGGDQIVINCAATPVSCS